MYFLNEITPMKLMKRQALLPINLEDKKKGSLIYLLGPNYESCINMTKIPMFLNRSLSYQSYYVDKNVSYYINNKNYLQESVDINNSENILYPDKDMDEELVSYCEAIVDSINESIFKNKDIDEEMKSGQKHFVKLVYKEFSKCKYDSNENSWKLRDPEDTRKNKIGNCHDQALLIYHYLSKMKIKCGRLFIIEHNGNWPDAGATHTACWYQLNNDDKFYWIETSWKSKRNIHGPFNSLDDLKQYISEEWQFSNGYKYLVIKPLGSVKPGMTLKEYVMSTVSEKDFKNSINESFNILESEALSSKERKELPDKSFGLPKKRKYPIHDKKHVMLAIKFFNHCDDVDKEELARNINKAIDKLFDDTERKDIHVGKNNGFSVYWHSSDVVNEYSEDISFSKSFKDVKIIVDSLSSDDLLSICDGNFKESPYILYREVIKISDKPVSFIEIYNLPTMKKNTGFIVIASDSNYRRNGYASILLDRAKTWAKNNNIELVYKTKPGNNKSISLERKYKLIDESYLLESEDTLPSTTTNPDNLSDRIEKIPYIPEMKSAEDVLNAIKSFNLIPKQVQKDVSALIFKAADEYGVDIKVTSDNNLYKYNMLRTAKDHIESDKESEEVNYRPTFSSNDYEATNEYFRGRNYITFYPDAYLTEDGKYDAQLRKLLYNERLKTNKDVFAIYDKVKEDNPLIKKTFSNLKLYKGLNLFVDLSYYTEVFFKNNFWKADKGIELYFDFVCRLINDARYDQYGYKEKTIFIPVDDWNKNKNVDLWDHRKCINPISMIVRMAKRFPELLQAQLKDFNVIFIGEQTYFRVDFSKFDRSAAMKFITLIKRVINKDVTTDDMNDPDIDSKNVIVATIVDQIETSGKTSVKINNLVGTKKVSEEELKKRKANQVSSSNATDKKARQDSNKKVEIKEKKAAEKSKEKASEELVDAIAKAAENNTNVDDAINDMDKDTTGRIEAIINQLAEEETEVNKVSAARSSRILKLEKELEKKSLKGSSIKNLIEKSKTADPLPVKKIPIDSINEEWQELTFANFNESYDINADIMAILNSFSQMTSPISVRDVKVENTSTSEDLVETWTAQCEDYKGQRFTLKFDIPLFIDNKFMRLRGNMKTLQGQLMLLPIIKTDGDTCQIVSNYNKIFIRRTNTNTGKSNCTSDKIIKTLLKNKFKNIKVVEWDNSKISNKYELPIDYIDISGVFDKIEIKETDKTTVFMFNQEEIRRNYKYDLSQGLPVGYTSKMGKETVLYYKSDTNMTFSQFLLSFLLSFDNEFYDAYSAIKSSSKYTYTTCSILNTNIPTVVVMGYSEGLTAALSKSNIKFQLKEKIDKELETQGYDRIKFNDGFLYFEDTYIGSLLVNGLKECDTDNYSLADINSKSMWVNFLDYFGGRIKADGLDNFYDLMMDPITVNICKEYDLPYDYISALAYANMLLADNKYNKHVDISGNKFRTTEIIAGYTYRALAKSYGEYKNQLKRNPKAIMTIKQSAVIDLVIIDPTMSDASILTPLLEMETANAVTFKGLSGMNSERSYGLDKRTFDDSMLNVLAMSTGFAGNVGMTRQMTINSNIDNNRGHIGKSKKNMGTVNSLCITEALTPFGTTHDDPMRTAMTFIQSSKHAMRVRHASPALITNGADQALPYLTTDIFAHKAKYKGVVKERTDEYIVIEYDNKTTEFVDLRERVEKNSDGGFYVTLKLDSDLKKGDKVKPMDIVAYDKGSYSDSVGAGALAYNMGTLSKVAILVTDEGYEDSCIVSEWLSKAMSSDIVVKKDVVLPPDTNVLSIVKRGQPIQEGETLILFQNTFDEDEMNVLVKTLSDDEELVSDLGRIPIKSKNTGVVQDIKVYRTIDKEQLSPSLKKIVNQYESEANKLKKVAKGANNESIANTEFGATDKLPATGKLKDTSEAVKIEFYIKYRDDFSVGDKLVVQSALKGVCKDIFPEGQEPYSDFRKEEPIDLFLSTLSVSARMVCSIEVSGGINKVLIELARKVKDIMGISYPMNVHGKDQTFD